MQRRDVLAGLGMGTAAFALAGAASAAQPRQQRDANDHGDHLEIMANCARACAQAAAHCLDQLREGSGDSEKHANALQHAAACEDFCILSAKLAACENPLAHLAHEANAQACEACATACEGHEDPVMKECVELCRACAEHCRKMSHEVNHPSNPR